MPLLILTRIVTSLLSVLLIVAWVYFLWTWYDGEQILRADGVAVHVRDAWRLWAALGLLACSALGRFPLGVLLGARDRERPGVPDDKERLSLRRGNGLALNADGSSLYIEKIGPAGGPTIVLTHGWGLDSTIWDYAKRDLATRYRIIVWDLPGLGRSRLKGKVSVEVIAASLGKVVALAGGRVVLVGHSIGGMAIQTLVRDRPEMFGREVAGVVLFNTTYTDPSKTMYLASLAKALRFPVIIPALYLSIWLWPLSWLNAWQSYLSGAAHLANRIQFGRRATRSQLEAAALLGTRSSPAVLARGNLAMLRWDATGALSRVGCPVRILGGGSDLVTKLTASETLSASSPKAHLQAVPGVGHLGFLERSDVYDAAIENFVNSEEVSRALRSSDEPAPLSGMAR